MPTFTPVPQPIGFIIGQRMRIRAKLPAIQGPITGFALSFFVIDRKGITVFEKNGADITIIEEGNGIDVDAEIEVQIYGPDTIGLAQNLSPTQRYEWSVWRTDTDDEIPMAVGPFKPESPPTKRPF